MKKFIKLIIPLATGLVVGVVVGKKNYWKEKYHSEQESLKHKMEALKIEMNRAYTIVPELREYSLLARGPVGAKGVIKNSEIN